LDEDESLDLLIIVTKFWFSTWGLTLMLTQKELKFIFRSCVLCLQMM